MKCSRKVTWTLRMKILLMIITCGAIPVRDLLFIKAVLKERRDAFPDLETKLESIVAEGNLVAWYRTQSGTHNKNYWGCAPSGKKITWHEMAPTPNRLAQCIGGE